MGELGKFHLADWESLSFPKSWGGWGFKHLGLFNTALCAKSLWRGLCKTGMWGDIIHAKYLKILPLSLWLRAGKFHSCNPSLMWKSLFSALPCILDHLRWQVGDGSSITLGLDRMVGVSIWNLSRPLLSALEARNIILLK